MPCACRAHSELETVIQPQREQTARSSERLDWNFALKDILPLFNPWIAAAVLHFIPREPHLQSFNVFAVLTLVHQWGIHVKVALPHRLVQP